MSIKSIFTIFLLLFYTLFGFSQKDVNLIISLKNHTDEVHSVAFSPDSKQFISGSKDETIKIWDLETKHEINTIQRHYATIYELEYSFDGNFIFSGGDKTINVWNKDGSFVKSLSGHATAVWSIGSSKDGNYLVSGSFDHNFRLWDINKGETIHIFENNKKSILATAFSFSNNLIACGSADGSIDLYTFDNFEHIHSFSGHGSNIYSLAFSEDGKYLASASRDSQIKIWDLENMKIYHVLSGHERSVMSVKFSKNSKFLVSCSYDTSVRLWDIESGKEIYNFLGHKLPVNDVDISSDNKYIISASSDKAINLWQLNPEILIEFYFEDEFQNELEASQLFAPRKPTESKTEYKERKIKAEQFKADLLSKYLLRLNTP